MVKKIISCWGSPGSGKSTISLALAARLAAKQNNCIIISTSTTVPMLPVFLPSLRLTGAAASIGHIVTSKKIDKGILSGRIHIHPQNERIGFMGMCSGETPITYKAFDREKIIELLTLLSDMAFDYIIFDCESNPVNDTATLIALEVSDVVLRSVTPDVRGVEFNKTHCMWLKNGANFRIDRHIKICSPVKDTSPMKEIIAVAGDFDYILPFAAEVDDAFSGGSLVQGFSLAQGIEFENNIEKIVGVIMNV